MNQDRDCLDHRDERLTHSVTVFMYWALGVCVGSMLVGLCTYAGYPRVGIAMLLVGPQFAFFLGIPMRRASKWTTAKFYLSFALVRVLVFLAFAAAIRANVANPTPYLLMLLALYLLLLNCDIYLLLRAHRSAGESVADTEE